MNDVQTAGSLNSKSRPSLLTRVDQLQDINRQLNVDVNAQLIQMRDRISSICYRINPERDPGEKIDKLSEPKNNNDSLPRDGLQAGLDNVIDQGNKFAVNFFDQTLPSINILLSYIEEHI